MDQDILHYAMKAAFYKESNGLTDALSAAWSNQYGRNALIGAGVGGGLGLVSS